MTARVPFKDYVYSPIQHAALWLGSWLYGAASVEDVEYALVELYGPVMIAPEAYPLIEDLTARGIIADQHLPSSEHISLPATHEEVLRLLTIIRGWRAAHGALDGVATESVMDGGNVGGAAGTRDRHAAPALVISLTGPGIPGSIPVRGRDGLKKQGVPPGSPAIQVLSPDGMSQLIVAFVPFPDGLGSRICLVELGLPPVGLSYLSPGQADKNLSDAVRASARMIDALGELESPNHPNPRLLVGTLGDHYDVAGLPAAMPPRAEKLIARADRVSAIIEAVADRLGNHSYDPQLTALWRPLLAARETAVAYALAEWGRRID